MAKTMEKQSKRELRGTMISLLMFIPNLVGLLVSLLRDERVSKADKAILAGTIIYVISPLDIIPDFIPFIGQVDDAFLLAISILRLLNRTERDIVLEHWHGKTDIKALVTNISTVAEVFLPARVRNVLRGRVERGESEPVNFTTLDDPAMASD